MTFLGTNAAVVTSRNTSPTQTLASQARLFRAVAELTARESHEEEELLPELLQREKSLVAFENVIVTWDPRSGFIACIKLILLGKHVGMKVENRRHRFTHLLVLHEVRSRHHRSLLVRM